MSGKLHAATAFSTPSENFLDHAQLPSAAGLENVTAGLSDDEFSETYEIARTASELATGGWGTIALQFPDEMIGDAPRVVQALLRESQSRHALSSDGHPAPPPRLYILADTSYSSCCVDETAAEHVDAQVVVHYGRSCLSPTSRLPVVYVFTRHRLDHDSVVDAFVHEFPDKQASIVLMADLTYQNHVSGLAKRLQGMGYVNLLETGTVHQPTATLPNRIILDHNGQQLPGLLSSEINLREYAIFHISNPPTALLLTLHSRVGSLHILPTTRDQGGSRSSEPASTCTDNARRLLGRRYARLLSLAAAGTLGILINTLSVSNYLAASDGVRDQIAAAGKKSYTVVVGKLNPAKLANFAEIDGWVMIGCWESSLVENDSNFFKPVITPFELDAALAGDDNRVWLGDWWGGIENVKPPTAGRDASMSGKGSAAEGDATADCSDDADADEDESEVPQFDLRTGKLVSRSRQAGRARPKPTDSEPGTLALRFKSELATVNGVSSPGAEFLRSNRTWQGLGSDFASQEASTAVEEGRSGVARGYTAGEDGSRR